VKRGKTVLITLLIIIQIFILSHSQAQNLKVGEKKLKILSWNIYMLPLPFVSADKIKRAKSIASVIKNSDYDIIVFQEAFHSKARSILADSLIKAYPYQIGPANPGKNFSSTNSGVWIISRIPVTLISEIKFEACEGIDCMSKKGAVLVEGLFEGHKFQLVGTHLESGNNHTIRERQFTQIAEELLIPFEKEQVPQVICGDFNVDKYDNEHYNALVNKMGVDSYEIAGNCKFSYAEETNDYTKSETQYLIDYIFLKENGKKIKDIIRKVNPIKQNWKRKRNDLSDHYGICAEIYF